MRLFIDAGPTENGHRTRGIGWATRFFLQQVTQPLIQSIDSSIKASLVSCDPLPEDIARHGLSRIQRNPLARLTGVHPKSKYIMDRWKLIESATLMRFDVRDANVFLATDPYAIPSPTRHRATVAIMYDLIPLILAKDYSPPARDFYMRGVYAWHLRQMRNATHLIAISESSKRDVMRHLDVPEHRITVIHQAGAMQTERQPSQQDARDTLRVRYGMTKPFLLYVGAHDPRKNIRFLIDAFHESGLGPSMDLVFAGQLDHPGLILERYAKSLPASHAIRWLGYVPPDSISALYASARAFMFPSIYEGFGLPVLEAMGSGTPVVAAPCTSVPEIAGDAALYAQPTDSAAWARAMQQVASDDALVERLSAAGRVQAAKFSWAATARRIIELCAQVGHEHKWSR